MIALTAFAFVSSITPGPNNLMLMSSGANFGFVRSLPHMLGVAIGFVLMLLVVGGGLGAVVRAFPPVLLVISEHGLSTILGLAHGNGRRAQPRVSTILRSAPFFPASCRLPVGKPQGLDDGAHRDGSLRTGR
jgi:threonine/homoserine/homoserine lactone efflux protein